MEIYNIKEFIEYINVYKDKVTDDKVLNNWSKDIIQNMNPYILNSNSLLNFCKYIEYAHAYIDYKKSYMSPNRLYGNEINSTFKISFEEIKKKVISKKREPITRKVYNYYKNILEYELENGDFVEIREGRLVPPPIEINLYDIINLEVAKAIDPVGFRNNQINKII